MVHTLMPHQRQTDREHATQVSNNRDGWVSFHWVRNLAHSWIGAGPDGRDAASATSGTSPASVNHDSTDSAKGKAHKGEL